MRVWVLATNNKSKFVTYPGKVEEKKGLPCAWIPATAVPKRLPLMFPTKVTAQQFRDQHDIKAFAKALDLGAVSPEIEEAIWKLLTGMEG